MTRIEKYIHRVLEQMQSPDIEREEIRSELLGHLEESKKSYLEKGFSEKRAEKEAIADFGNPGFIGRGLQETIYPYQRGLLYAIGVATIIFGVIFYLNTTFNIGEPIPIWLAIQLVLGGSVTLAATNIAHVGRHFYLLNVLVFVSVIWSGIDLMMMQSASQVQAILFSLYLVILIGLGLLFIFRNSYYSSDQSESEPKKRLLVKLGYSINLFFGVVIVCIGLFYVWGFLAFMGAGWIPLIPLIPILVWLIFYKFQMRFIAKKPVLSLATGLLFSAVAIVMPLGLLFFFN